MDRWSLRRWPTLQATSADPHDLAVFLGEALGLAVRFAPPSERRVRVEDAAQARKMDVRLYTYASKALLAAARLYSGQTTNLRTPGGGFAPVLVVA